MKVIDWFAGIGGFRYGMEMCDAEFFQTVACSEIDPYACRVYQKHWPGTPNLGDITRVKPEDIPEADLWCGGFPCQPFSVAGKRGGERDERNLWPIWFDLIRANRPRYILGENVPGLLADRMFGTILGDLSSCGYDVEWATIGAHEVGAPHRRDRLWVWAERGVIPCWTECPACENYICNIHGTHAHDCKCPAVEEWPEPGPYLTDVGNASRGRREEQRERESATQARACVERAGLLAWPPGWTIDPADVPHTARVEREPGAGRWGVREGHSDVADANCPACGGTQGPTPSLLGRVAHGIPHRTHRLRCLGNAVVPQVVQWIAAQIKEGLTDA